MLVVGVNVLLPAAAACCCCLLLLPAAAACCCCLLLLLLLLLLPACPQAKGLHRRVARDGSCKEVRVKATGGGAMRFGGRRVASVGAGVQLLC
jgi:hypothetical protein